MRVAMTVAVVDAGDQLIAFERMDGADLVGITLARDKAFSALLNRMPTRDIALVAQPGTEFYGYDSLAGGRMVIFAGGMPLDRDGVLVGAVGVSGGRPSRTSGPRMRPWLPSARPGPRPSPAGTGRTPDRTRASSSARPVAGILERLGDERVGEHREDRTAREPEDERVHLTLTARAATSPRPSEADRGARPPRPATAG